MNEHTPRRYRGSLLERAAAQNQFAVPGTGTQPSFEQPVVVPMPAPQPAPPILAEEPQGPLLRRGHEVEALAPEPAIAAAPEPAAKPVVTVQPGTRRSAPIDRDALAEAGMLVPGGPITPLAEEFRMVKRQLLLTARAVAGADADRARMILVCSAQPDEGKTFCAINLALSMSAEKDVEILLVDADFAKPDVLERLGLPQGPGLLDALTGDVDVEDCIVDTDVPQLSVLPAGTRSVSDTELLASDKARRILDKLAAANPRRIVIFDSPPALAASPASVLALHAGQVMLVVRADRTSESDLRAAVAALDGCEHIQLVLNSVSFQPAGRRFGSYYEEAGR
ncbi:AAA family ATPase [Sphingomonas sp. dw_22]|uniref:AAA family ATPase n=1 Tax=Sphingomonas sp. dw_22 TaxID=2721175 RepID=UPI001BD43D0E|nr:AAA family ATPase [Sphingomonas sp. dw_22]